MRNIKAINTSLVNHHETTVKVASTYDNICYMELDMNKYSTQMGALYIF